MRVIAVDDEPLALRQMVSYINKIPFLECVGEFQSANDAYAFLQEESADGMFCDINMPDLNGLDFIKSLAAPPLVVLTTAYSEYALDGYKLDVVDYLLKPFSLDDVKRAANKMKRQFDLVNGSNTTTTSSVSQEKKEKETADDTIFVKTDYKMVKISVKDIRYIEGMSEYLRIYMEDNPKPMTVLLSMTKMAESLPPYFMRIHRSYIVNLNKIQEVNKNRVIMDKDTYLPIGDLYKDKFNEYVNSRYLGR